MNKRIILPGLGIVVATLVLLVLVMKLSHSGTAAGVAPGNDVERMHGTGISTTNIASLGERRKGPLSRIRSDRGPSTNSRRSVVSAMDPEMADNLEEMFEVTETLNALLDNGETDDALREARTLTTHSNREVRLAALAGMQWLGAPAAADMVLFFSDSDAEIRMEADEAFWDALDEFDDPALKVEMLKIALQYSTPSMRLRALDELIFLPDALSFGTIASMLNDPDAQVQSAARDQLEFVSEVSFNSEQDAVTWFNKHKDELEELEMW